MISSKKQRIKEKLIFDRNGFGEVNYRMWKSPFQYNVSGSLGKKPEKTTMWVTFAALRKTLRKERKKSVSLQEETSFCLRRILSFEKLNLSCVFSSVQLP
jgi:hypothetical protein